MNSKKVEAIIKRYTPKGVHVRWKRGMKMAPAHARADQREILSPDPRRKFPREEDQRRALATFLHECGHFRCGHFSTKLSLHREEYEAEMWAINVMRTEGIPVPHYSMWEVKKYVRDCIAADRKRGIKIERHVQHWASTKSRRGKVRTGEPVGPPREGPSGEPDQAQSV